MISTELNFTILYDPSQFSFPLDDLSNKHFTMTEPFRMQQEAFCQRSDFVFLRFRIHSLALFFAVSVWFESSPQQTHYPLKIQLHEVS